jgi:hypothetical protein
LANRFQADEDAFLLYDREVDARVINRDAVSDACHGDADASRLDPLLFCSHHDTHHQLLQLRRFAALIQHEPLLGRIGVRRATVSTSPHRNERRIAYNLSSCEEHASSGGLKDTAAAHARLHFSCCDQRHIRPREGFWWRWWDTRSAVS